MYGNYNLIPSWVWYKLNYATPVIIKDDKVRRSKFQIAGIRQTNKNPQTTNVVVFYVNSVEMITVKREFADGAEIEITNIEQCS